MSHLHAKELTVLRQAVDKAEKFAKTETAVGANTPEVKRMIAIVEQFLRKKKLICYGGTAINNILPQNDKFYMEGVDVPDYDFFSTDALADSKELADIYARQGFADVQAKAGVHPGTFKVFVHFIPVADVTQLDARIFAKVQTEAILRDGLYYAPPNFLRMSMYLELSRPLGDVSRWEKVFKRLLLLNAHYPLKNRDCQHVNFMRDFEDPKNIGQEQTAYTVVKAAAIKLGLVFIGGYASSLYGKYLPANEQTQIQRIPDFDLLALNPLAAATHIKAALTKAGFMNVKVNKMDNVGELLPVHYYVTIEADTVCFIYETDGCRSYNTLKVNKQSVKIGTIDTLLHYFLAFIYSNRDYYEHDRLMCMAEYLFNVQLKNKLAQKGLLKRFSLSCYGTQHSLLDMRRDRSLKYKEFATSAAKNSAEYNTWFLNYTPGERKGISNGISKGKGTSTSKGISNGISKSKSKSKLTRKKSALQKLMKILI